MKQPKIPAASREASPETGTDWLHRYQQGDGKAFRQLVDQFRDRMLQFFYRLCWDRDRAEDLSQDLFLKLLLNNKRYRPEGKMTTYVYRVATNLWIDHYRQQRPRPRLLSLDQVVYRDGEVAAAPEAASSEPGPVQQLGEQEERRALRQALERLTEPHRIVFELAVYQERPYGEIAELLGIPVGTVKSRMHNATAALKQLLAEGATDSAADSATSRSAAGGLRPRRGGVS